MAEAHSALLVFYAVGDVINLPASASQARLSGYLFQYQWGAQPHCHLQIIGLTSFELR